MAYYLFILSDTDLLYVKILPSNTHTVVRDGLNSIRESVTDSRRSCSSTADLCCCCWMFTRWGRSSLPLELPSPSLESSPCSSTQWLMPVLQGKHTYRRDDVYLPTLPAGVPPVDMELVGVRRRRFREGVRRRQMIGSALCPDTKVRSVSILPPALRPRARSRGSCMKTERLPLLLKAPRKPRRKQRPRRALRPWPRSPRLASRVRCSRVSRGLQLPPPPATSRSRSRRLEVSPEKKNAQFYCESQTSHSSYTSFH